MKTEKKVVIVTGAGTGIGRALALEFAKGGAYVIAVSRRENKISKTADIIKSTGGNCIAIKADVTDKVQVENMVSETLKKFKRIDILFNNAGSFNALGAVWKVDPDLWWNDVTVNLRGVMLCSRAVLPHMIKNDNGIIINMGGGNQIPGGTGYSCSKVGVIRFTELLAKELEAENSSVLTFTMSPGFVHTPMTEIQLKTEEGKRWLPSSSDAIKQGLDRPPEDCAVATIKLVNVACKKLNGKRFTPDTDFDKEVQS